MPGPVHTSLRAITALLRGQVYSHFTEKEREAGGGEGTSEGTTEEVLEICVTPHAVQVMSG